MEDLSRHSVPLPPSDAACREVADARRYPSPRVCSRVRLEAPPSEGDLVRTRARSSRALLRALVPGRAVPCAVPRGAWAHRGQELPSHRGPSLCRPLPRSPPFVASRAILPPFIVPFGRQSLLPVFPAGVPVGLARVGRRSRGATCSDSGSLRAPRGSAPPGWSGSPRRSGSRRPRACRARLASPPSPRRRRRPVRFNRLERSRFAWVRCGSNPGRQRPMFATHDSRFKAEHPSSRLTPPASHADGTPGFTPWSRFGGLASAPGVSPRSLRYERTSDASSPCGVPPEHSHSRAQRSLVLARVSEDSAQCPTTGPPPRDLSHARTGRDPLVEAPSPGLA